MNKVERQSKLHNVLLYICLDSQRISAPHHNMSACLATAQACLAAGVQIIQFRDKNSLSQKKLGALNGEQTIAYCYALKKLCHEYEGLFAVNDDPDLAAYVGADICHVGQNDIEVHNVRRIVGNEMLIGLSTHTHAQSLAAYSNNFIDYFCIGPIWETPTKPGRAGIGLTAISDFLKTISQIPVELRADKPWFAIGGINLANINQVREVGAKRVVVVRAIIDAERPDYATKSCMEALTLSL